MNKENFTTRIEPAFDYSVTDVFSGWERSLDCFLEIVKLIHTTGSTEQIIEMNKILAKYDIDLKVKNDQNNF